MKLSYLLFVSVIIFLVNIHSPAQIILAPGDEKVFTNDAATGGEAGDNGNFLFSLDSDFDANTKTIKAEALSAGLGSIGTGSAYALIYYDFQISETPETHDNTVGAWINYEAIWQGYQAILASLGSNSYVNIELILRDVNLGKVIKRETIHDLDLKTYSFKVIVGGFNFNDSDIKTNTFSAILTRGHSYVVGIKLIATLFITIPSAAPSNCDYMNGFFGGGDGRAVLSYLKVKVGLDEKETLQKLALIDSLESRIDTLEYRLDHHYHTYLTGRGVGHNNTEANTTLSIFEEGNVSGTTPPVNFDSQQENIPDKNTENQSAPDDFSLEQNYPNPFNPNTNILFAIPSQDLVTIKVYDVLGRQVEELMNEIKTPGYYNINFNAGDLPSGTYFYEIRAGNFVETKKMVLLK